MTRRPLPALIIGAGLMGRHHAEAAVVAGAAIVGVVDQDLEAASRLASRFRCTNAQVDLHEAIRRSNAAVVHVCTPVGSHAAIATIIASAGLHALFEKPLGVDADDVRRIYRRFEEGSLGKLVCPTHQYAFQRSVVEAVAALPKIGTLKRISFDICSAGAAGERITGDELVAEILPHPLAVLQRLQPTTNLLALEWKLVRAGDGEWALATCSNGSLVTMAVSAGGRPTHFKTSITGERGSIEIDNFHDFAVLLPGKVSRAQKIAAPFSESTREFFCAGRNLLARAARRELAYPGLRALVSEFYKAIHNSTQPPVTPEQSIDVAEGRDVILSLAARG